MSSARENNPGETAPVSPSVRFMAEALDQIDHTLEQMLALAQLSASDLDVDRTALQKTLERLQNKIDQIADQLDAIQGVEN